MSNRFSFPCRLSGVLGCCGLLRGPDSCWTGLHVVEKFPQFGTGFEIELYTGFTWAVVAGQKDHIHMPLYWASALRIQHVGLSGVLVSTPKRIVQCQCNALPRRACKIAKDLDNSYRHTQPKPCRGIGYLRSICPSVYPIYVYLCLQMDSE